MNRIGGEQNREQEEEEGKGKAPVMNRGFIVSIVIRLCPLYKSLCPRVYRIDNCISH